jgi:hypothetical protein
MGIAQARADMQVYLKKEWAVDIVLTAPAPGSEIASVTGFSSLHNLQIDPETGNPVDSRNAHVSVSEAAILEGNPDYPTRINDEPYLKDHLVRFSDASGKEHEFIIDRNFVNETFNVIVCILGEYVNY